MPLFSVNTHRIDPYKNFKFRVKIGSRTVAGLSKMSALKKSTEVIEWREAGATAGGTELVLAGDGTFVTGSFSYSEIGGENPRVLIKLKGMQSPYRGPAPRGAGPLVRGVRTGFHVTPTGNEIHVVVDLARGGVKVSGLAPANAGLTLTLAP